MPKHLEKISEEVLHENPWWKYKHDIYKKPNGDSGDYFYGETNGNAMIIPILPDGQLVMVVQSRYLRGKESIEFPCGGIMDGDTILETAKKELAEETGCLADEFIKVGEFEGLNGVFKDVCHVFLAYVTEQKEQKLDDSEDMEVIYRRSDEIDEMVQKNEIWDGQTMAAWAMVHHRFLHD